MFETLSQIISGASIELPAVEVTVLLVVIAVCLVSRHTNVGLIATYIFAYRWGWKLFAGHSIHVMTVYLFFGTITGILTVIGMMTNKHD